MPRRKGIALDRAMRGARYRAAAFLSRSRPDGHVLMLHTGRSGSTLLGDLLDQHSRIVWDGEILEKMFHRLAARQGRGINELYGQYSLADGIAEIARRKRSLAGNAIFGMEIQDYHLDLLGTDVPSFLAEAQKLGFTRFIVLDRANAFRKLVSHMIAQSRGMHHVRPGARIEKPTIEIRPERVYAGHRYRTMLDVLDSYRNFLRDVRQALAGSAVLELRYMADISANPLDAYRKVCGYLDLVPEEPRPNFGKTTPFELSEIVSNIDEVKAALANTEYAWMTSAATTAENTGSGSPA